MQFVQVLYYFLNEQTNALRRLSQTEWPLGDEPSEETVRILLQIVSSYEEQFSAEAYLTRDNLALQAAGRSWTEEHTPATNSQEQLQQWINWRSRRYSARRTMVEMDDFVRQHPLALSSHQDHPVYRWYGPELLRAIDGHYKSYLHPHAAHLMNIANLAYQDAWFDYSHAVIASATSYWASLNLSQIELVSLLVRLQKYFAVRASSGEPFWTALAIRDLHQCLMEIKDGIDWASKFIWLLCCNPC